MSSCKRVSSSADSAAKRRRTDLKVDISAPEVEVKNQGWAVAAEDPVEAVAASELCFGGAMALRYVSDESRIDDAVLMDLASCGYHEKMLKLINRRYKACKQLLNEDENSGKYTDLKKKIDECVVELAYHYPETVQMIVMYLDARSDSLISWAKFAAACRLLEDSLKVHIRDEKTASSPTSPTFSPVSPRDYGPDSPPFSPPFSPSTPTFETNSPVPTD